MAKEARRSASTLTPSFLACDFSPETDVSTAGWKISVRVSRVSLYPALNSERLSVLLPRYDFQNPCRAFRHLEDEFLARKSGNVIFVFGGDEPL